MYQPKTGIKCNCRKGVQRDNCQNCEGTGFVIDFRAIREASKAREHAQFEQEYNELIKLYSLERVQILLPSGLQGFIDSRHYTKGNYSFDSIKGNFKTLFGF
jgi:hypothetical protein